MQEANSSDFPAIPRAGIENPYDALLYLPRKHVAYDLASALNLRALEGRTVVLALRVTSRPSPGQKKGRFSLMAADECGVEHRIMVFGMLKRSPWEEVTPGQTIHVQTKIVVLDGRPFLNNVELIDSSWVGRIIPFYPAKPGIASGAKIQQAAAWAIASQQTVSDAALRIRQAFAGLEEAELLNRSGVKGSLSMMLYAIHAPRTLDMADWGLSAARRLAIENLRYLAERSSEKPLRMETILRFAPETIQRLLDQLPYTPTSGERGQEDAIRRIFVALAQPHAAHVVLTADVGVGKTLCYMVPSVATQLQGGRVCVVVPNSILAASIANEFRSAYPEIPIAEVTDSKNAKSINWAANPILIGTVRLNGIAKRFKWIPNLLVVDEQQKMSIEQRNALCGSNTNVIEASATPLPQTIAMLRYGSKYRVEVDKQHAQKAIHTRVTSAADRGLMFAHLRQLVRSGFQAAIIYPRVAGNEADDRKSVETAGEKWEQLYPGQVVTIHGRMSAEDKAHAMAEARGGQKSIIVASSIIEIGVTISNLRFLIVVNADRYGVSTLHQMRGRLARNGGEGWCYLYLPEEVEDETLERVTLLEKTTNGFELAELDMRIRGFGDLSGEGDDQSGKSQTLFRGIQLMPQDFEALERTRAYEAA